MINLTPVMRKFILHWGEMGTRWGVNRTVAQVHALLYLAPEPLNAEDISKALSVARSNVSTSLRELEAWGIVRAVHRLGDRREHYESMKDVWEMARVICDERKRREIDPTLAVLRECLTELDHAKPADAALRQRVADMLSFVEALTSLYEEIHRLPPTAVRGLLKASGKLRKLVGSGRIKADSSLRSE
ncbi:MAG TPA: MarR family transcriptional regulator [Terriglobia bacterium]|nr:MarR family transcriptional regulator [Terriglobia bacterium]